MAVLIFGDPRLRSVYDVFGFALLGAVLAELLNLDEPEEAARDLEDPD